MLGGAQLLTGLELLAVRRPCRLVADATCQPALPQSVFFENVYWGRMASQTEHATSA